MPMRWLGLKEEGLSEPEHSAERASASIALMMRCSLPDKCGAERSYIAECDEESGKDIFTKI